MPVKDRVLYNINMYVIFLVKKSKFRGFPGGAVDKNPPMQGTRVQALVREDPTCHGATKPVCHNY